MLDTMLYQRCPSSQVGAVSPGQRWEGGRGRVVEGTVAGQAVSAAQRVAQQAQEAIALLVTVTAVTTTTAPTQQPPLVPLTVFTARHAQLLPIIVIGNRCVEVGGMPPYPPPLIMLPGFVPNQQATAPAHPRCGHTAQMLQLILILIPLCFCFCFCPFAEKKEES